MRVQKPRGGSWPVFITLSCGKMATLRSKIIRKCLPERPGPLAEISYQLVGSGDCCNIYRWYVSLPIRLRDQNDPFWLKVLARKRGK